jgi:hypothetical protein
VKHLYIAFADKVQRNVQFPVPAETARFTTKRYKILPIRTNIAPQKESDQLTYTTAVSEGSREATVAFNFISERSVRVNVSILEKITKKINVLGFHCCVHWTEMHGTDRWDHN